VRSLTCGQNRPLLEPFVDGLLDEENAASVRAHLKDCADCRVQHREAVSIPSRLRALRSPEPPGDLVANVMRSVASHRAPRFAWGPVVLEVLLSALIGWYVSGFAGLADLASITSGELAQVLGWGTGSAQLPAAPSAPALLFLACVALLGVTIYHLALIVRRGDDQPARTRRLA
jgi:anti-sigma factor RsiW